MYNKFGSPKIRGYICKINKYMETCLIIAGKQEMNVMVKKN